MPDRFASGKVTNAFENRVESKFADKQDKVCEEVEKLSKEWNQFNPAWNQHIRDYSKFIEDYEETWHMVVNHRDVLRTYKEIIRRLVYSLLKHPILMWLNYHIFHIFTFAYTGIIFPDGKKGVRIVVGYNATVTPYVYKSGKWYRATYKDMKKNKKAIMDYVSEQAKIKKKDINQCQFEIHLTTGSGSDNVLDLTDPNAEVFKYG